MTKRNLPIEPHEADALFAPFAWAVEKPCALAVSGGPDSTALMVLFADWLRRNNTEAARHVVLTVDHGLRAASASEARAVARQAEHLGLRHRVLAWPGPKPQTGIQAAARSARYRAIAEFMSMNGIASVFTAHTRDDQAETLLMRLARGSGLDGLAAMAPAARFGESERSLPVPETPLRILRPLLEVPKERLVETLRLRGIGWIEDPTNEASEFERTRWRAARAELDKLGLTNEMLALSASRLGRARSAIEAVTERFLAPAQRSIAADQLGRITIDREKLRDAGHEIALRVLGRAVAAAGGSEQRPSLQKLEAIVADLLGRESSGRAWTLSRAKITASATSVLLEREPGREPLPEVSLERGTSAVWDGRFAVSASAEMPATQLVVRPLGEAGLAELRREDAGIAAAPLGPAALSPGFWIGDRLIAAPPLQHWRDGSYRGALRADFIGTARFDCGVPLA